MDQAELQAQAQAQAQAQVQSQAQAQAAVLPPPPASASPVAISPATAANVAIGTSPAAVHLRHATLTPTLLTPSPRQQQQHAHAHVSAHANVSAHAHAHAHAHALSTASPEQYHQGYLAHQGMSSPVPAYPTDGLCARPLVRLIIDDYLRLVYPLVPVVHRPSFQQAFAQDRDVDSAVFLSLLLAMCSLTVGLLPSRWPVYRAWQPGPALRFEGREEMMNYCYATVFRLRGPRYFDEINFEKFAVSYLLSVTFVQIGDQNRARMLEVEAMQLGRLLQLHKIREYEGLSCVEAQLRKKGFWLMYYAHVHSELQNLRKEKLSYLDAHLLASLNLEELLPLDLDDEQIEEYRVLPRPGDGPGLTTAFIIHSRVFWAAMRPVKEESRYQQQQQLSLSSTSSSSSSSSFPVLQEPPCICRPWRDRTALVTQLRERLHEVKYILDVLPAELQPWASAPADESDVLGCQFASLRANLHVTHLWLQSIIMDQLEVDNHSQQHPSDAALGSGSGSSSGSASASAAAGAGGGGGGGASSYFEQREDIVRQLLYLLHAIPERDMEPNGLHLAFKIRDIAVGLLDDGLDANPGTASGQQRTPASAKRVAAYIDELTRILARLDRSEQASIVNLQSWVDTGRTRRT